jgi:hypothetical protein
MAWQVIIVDDEYEIITPVGEEFTEFFDAAVLRDRTIQELTEEDEGNTLSVRIREIK